MRAIRAGKIRFHALTSGHYPGEALDTAALPGINSVGFWDAVGAQDWGLEPHRNEGVEVVFLETGSTVFTVDRQRHELRAGHFTVTRPWQLHTLGAPNLGPGRLHWLIVDVGVRRPNQAWRWPPWIMLRAPDLEALTRKLRHNEHPVWNVTPGVAQGFQGLAQAVLHPADPRRYSRIRLHLNQILLGILDALTEQQGEEDPQLTSRQRTVELFLQDIERNAASASQPWTLDRMAAACGLGVTAFSKYCHAIVNAGPMAYLNQCRLDQAARRLREEPARPVTQIAFAAGFNSSQYFATRFHQHFHCTPREYRSGVAPGARKEIAFGAGDLGAESRT